MYKTYKYNFFVKKIIFREYQFIQIRSQHIIIILRDSFIDQDYFFIFFFSDENIYLKRELINLSAINKCIK